MTGRFCDRCGERLEDGNAEPASGSRARPGVTSGPGHEQCQAARRLEPPRYCAHCGRRMVVQVSPDGWTARCAAHGMTSHLD